MSITHKTLQDPSYLQETPSEVLCYVEGEDDLGVVLRAHIYIEHEIQEYITEVAANPEHIKFRDYDYDSVVAIAFALGLEPELKHLFSNCNLRNKFAIG